MTDFDQIVEFLFDESIHSLSGTTKLKKHCRCLLCKLKHGLFVDNYFTFFNMSIISIMVFLAANSSGFSERKSTIGHFFIPQTLHDLEGFFILTSHYASVVISNDLCQC